MRATAHYGSYGRKVGLYTIETVTLVSVSCSWNIANRISNQSSEVAMSSPWRAALSCSWVIWTPKERGWGMVSVLSKGKAPISGMMISRLFSVARDFGWRLFCARRLSSSTYKPQLKKMLSQVHHGSTSCLRVAKLPSPTRGFSGLTEWTNLWLSFVVHQIFNTGLYDDQALNIVSTFLLCFARNWFGPLLLSRH